MEESRNDKTVKSRNHQLSNQAKDFESFLNEGRMYLDMADSLHESNENSSVTAGFMLKALDVYTRLKIQLQEDTLEMYEFWLSDEEEEEEEDLADVPFEQLNDEDVEDDGDTEEDENNFDDIDHLYMDEFEFLGYEDYLEWHGEISYRRMMLGNIELLIMRIRELCAKFIKLRLSLYLLLTDYCERARQFLRRNTRLRVSGKSRRGKREPACNVSCEYSLLERMVARIGERQEHIAKYLDLTCDNTSRRLIG